MSGFQAKSGAAAAIGLVANVHVTRRYPVSVIHFVTNRCNARCPFCFIDFDDPETFRGELTVDEIDRITRTMGPCLQNVNITGGEPFARKELLDIARCWFANAGVRSMFITTNGSLPDRVESFTRRLLDEFPDRKVIFSFSLDAFPERHDEIRKLPGLFENAIRSYRAVRAIGGNAMANVAITVSEENCGIAGTLYDALIDDYGVDAITATLVRDEGVYVVPPERKAEILRAYDAVTRAIARDLKSGRLKGYDTASLQGRLMNRKNVIVNEVLKDTYLEPRYVSPCRAGALFGVIGAEGTVSPCEILSTDFGSLRDHDYDFLRIWHGARAAETRRWIVDSKCHCSYECAWSFNVLGNARYQPALLAAALGKHW